MQAAWMIAASLFFAGMGVCIKFASDSFDPLEVVFYRGVISVVFIGALARSRGVSLRTHVPMMHVWRNVVGVASLVCWFYAIGQLPLSTAITLNYMSGIWIAAFIIGGTLAMGQLADVRRQGPLILTVMAGFVGVVLLLRPTLEQNQLFAGLVGLLGSLMVLSASSVYAFVRYDDAYYFVKRQVLFLVIGCEWSRSHLAESDRCSAPVSAPRVPAGVSAPRTSVRSVARWAIESATI